MGCEYFTLFFFTAEPDPWSSKLPVQKFSVYSQLTHVRERDGKVIYFGIS